MAGAGRGRPKKWASDAERKAAARAAENGAPTGDEVPASSTGHEVPGARADELPAGDAGHEVPTAGSEKLPDAGPGSRPATVQWQGQAWPILRAPPAGGREAYVAAAKRGAELELQAGRSNPIVADAGRLERAAAYAEWRYDGWLAGQVDGL